MSDIRRLRQRVFAEIRVLAVPEAQRAQLLAMAKGAKPSPDADPALVEAWRRRLLKMGMEPHGW